MHWTEVEPSEGLRIAVLGEGSDFDLTAAAQSAGAAAIRDDAHVIPLACGEGEFKDCVQKLASIGFQGVSVCNPFKAEAASMAKQFFVVKHGLGVANALRLGPQIYAQNTEVPAFAMKIRDVKPGLALVMGSGRAARSAVMSLFECGWRVRVWNRNVIRSRPFAMVFETYGNVEIASHADPVGCSLIVNATPLGAKAGEQPPVRWSAAGPRTTCVDFVYRNVATEFLRSAAQREFRTVDGRELLVEQAAQALEWWLGIDVPREPMYAAIGFTPRDRRPGQ